MNYFKINLNNRFYKNKSNNKINKKFKFSNKSISGYSQITKDINLYKKNNYFEKFSNNIYNNNVCIKNKEKIDKLINKRKIKFKDGSKYNGYIVKNKFNGFGIYETKNNIKYIGNWINNKMNGKGKLYLNNKLIYKGNFKNNFYNGYGILYNLNNEINFNFDWKFYKGMFDNNLLQPIGELFLKDESKFIGEFKNSKIDGIGYILKNDEKQFSIWKENKLIRKIN